MAQLFRSIFGSVFGSVYASEEGDSLPTENLLLKMLSGTMVDSVGDSTLTFSSGDASDLMSAQFSFDSGAVALQLDTLEGGDVLFDSTDSMAAITRYGYEWYALLNMSFLWVGPNGIVGYSTDQSADELKIKKYLGYYSPNAAFPYTLPLILG